MASWNNTYCWEDINNPSAYIHHEGEKYDIRPFKRFVQSFPFVFEDDEETETFFVSTSGTTEQFPYPSRNQMLEKYPILGQFYNI